MSAWKSEAVKGRGQEDLGDGSVRSRNLNLPKTGLPGSGIESNTRRLKVCRIVTVPQTFQTLLREQLRCILAHDIELTLVCSSSPGFEKVVRDVGARSVAIAMERKPAPVADLVSLFKVARFLFQNRFDVVHSSTPKAGLITALAGRLARVPASGPARRRR